MTSLIARTLIVVALATAPAALLAQQQPWNDRSQPPAARAAALVKAMTRAEKLQYVHGLFPPKTEPRPADMVPSAGYVPGIARLGIPTLRESDASLGVANQVEQRKGDVATALPASLATAASFDPALAFAGGAMIGAEARAKTFNVLLAGGVNLTRDAWGGRDFEYLGEDPLLAGVMAGASVRGVQSNHIVSTVKHYALNPQETDRMLVDARIGEAALVDSDLRAFHIAIEDGKPGSVMCGYNLVNGDWDCENRFLLTTVLRDRWRYPGFVMSDWGAVHSTEKAALAGLDQESGQELDREIYFGKPLADAVAAGRVPEARLDRMVMRILTGVIASGLYDDPTPATVQPIDYDAHADVAQKVAEEGIVLLRNEGGVLPLAKSAKRIVLIGGHADAGVLSGGGSSQVRSVGGVPVEIPLKSGPAASFARITWHNSSPLKAIRALAPGAEVTYIDGSDPAAAAAAARDADVAIFFATQWRTEAEDLASLALPDGQDALIEAVAAANPHSVVVLETGGPVLMPWLNKVPAMIEAWYPGQRGGEALARILFGAVNPSGHLPMTFPASEAQLPRPHPVTPAGGAGPDSASNAGSGDSSALAPFPVPYREGADVGYRWYARQGETPLFPFGYGLGYSRFSYRAARFAGGAEPGVEVTVTNDSDRAGVAVPQLYVARAGEQARLAGWQRVALAPHASRRVTIGLDPRALADWREGAWQLPAGRYRLTLATDAATPIASESVAFAQQTNRETH
ncbi:MAG TPA: beta-glucosidase [Sphingomonas sp.]|nr:beta-glucosidase [Sphingomonas sp.]